MSIVRELVTKPTYAYNNSGLKNLSLKPSKLERPLKPT